MKPFNLERAIAGDPVITRDGISVIIAGVNKETEHKGHVIAGWMDGIVHCWTEDGKCYIDGKISHNDLFMAPKKRILTTWINWYPDGYCYAWETKEQADSSQCQNRIACTYHSIEVDEE